MGPMNPLVVGAVTIDPPVVLAPMAGITNRAFRRLCREQGAGLYVSEMVTSRALIERHEATLDMVRFDEDESPRSVQLYGVDPSIVSEAVRMVVEEDLADHVDLNFGCPVPKVTRKGGGSALPWKRDLFADIVTSAVSAAAGRVPVTVKMRKGIDDDHLTYLEAGRVARDAGVAWVALHGRTAAQMYGGVADWSAIARLVEELDGFPVLGNGDIFSAQDALDMVRQTGCAGVVVGRGCLGRPWLFGQLAAAFAGKSIPADPALPIVIATFRRHAELLIEAFGEYTGSREIRKHVAWYFKGYSVKRQVRQGLANVSSLAEVDDWLAQVDPDQAADEMVMSAPRGRTGGERPPALPDGWLDSPYLDEASAACVREAELSVSGG
ncbi:MAG: tRNA dihydrouridine synthase DusB [Candidatus Nanopelagicales bacterium]|jgi:nifR3 family TIM-barrel protein